MKNQAVEEVKNVLKKYIRHTDNVDVTFEIMEKECNKDMTKIFVSECGKFLTDSFTFLSEMDDVPRTYRERLFQSFYGKEKKDLNNKWFKKLFRNDKTYAKHLSSHVSCLMCAFVNEQKRIYGIDNVKQVF